MTGTSEKQEVLLEYRDSHHYDCVYEKLDMFCPNCGQREVWHDLRGGDYYVGKSHVCTACDHGFTIQGPSEEVEEQDLKVLWQLKNGIKLKATTRPGN